MSTTRAHRGGVRRAASSARPSASSTCSPSTSATGSAGTGRSPPTGRPPPRSWSPGPAASARYAREWLEQQAVTGVLDGRRRTAGSGCRRAPAEVLTDADSLSYLAPLARMFGAAAVQLPALLDAYRDRRRGELGRVRRRHARVAGRHEPALVPAPAGRDAAPACPSVDAVLRRPGARIADVGCGAGWSSIALARAYPRATVEGWDIDAPSIDLARAARGRRGPRGPRRVLRGRRRRAAGAQAYDAVFAFECIHDMPDPVAVLRGDAPGGPPDGVGRGHGRGGGRRVRARRRRPRAARCTASACSSACRTACPRRRSVGTGTVMRPETLRGYAQEAGFSDIEVLPTGEFGFFRFYRLLP